MADIDKIGGPGVHTIIEALQSDQTLVKLRIPAKDFNHLTIITGLDQTIRKLTFELTTPTALKKPSKGSMNGT